jgi:hypothetical protein
MPLQIKELAFLKGVDHWTPDLGAKLAEMMLSIQTAHNNIEAQVNGNSMGGPKPPPNIDAVRATGQNGFLHIAVEHHADFYRGVKYYAEHADNPQFTNPHPVYMGDVRNISVPVGPGPRYVRAYAAYSSSVPGQPAYHGSAAEPTMIDPGGAGPSLLPPQGSGTGRPRVGLQGPGTEPFRPVDGRPPDR